MMNAYIAAIEQGRHEAVLAEIRGAVLRERALGFVYSRPDAPARKRAVAPCGLMFARANYLVGADLSTGRVQMRTASPSDRSPACSRWRFSA